MIHDKRTYRIANDISSTDIVYGNYNGGAVDGVINTESFSVEPGNAVVFCAVEDSIVFGLPDFAATYNTYDLGSCGSWDDEDIPDVPPFTLSETHDDVSVNGDNDGAIDITVNDGSGNFTYLWDDGPTTQDRSALLAGTYRITVTDVDTGQIGSLIVVIEEPDALEASASKTNSTANGADDGTITLTVSGGSGNYTYAWGDGPITQNRSGLAPGIYSVVITDAITGEVVTITNIAITEPAVQPPVQVYGKVLQFPLLNPFRFVVQDTLDDCDNPENADNVLFCEETIPGFKVKNYFNKVCTCDIRLVQFYSDFLNHVLELKDALTDEVVETYGATLKEQNIGEEVQYGISIRNYIGHPGQSKVYFSVGAPPIPLQIGDTFEVVNNGDGFDGVYSIVNIVTDSSLGYQFLVINLNYTAGGATSPADGNFISSLTDYNVFEAVVDFSEIDPGKYYFKLTASSDNQKVAIAEPIDLKVSHPKTKLITYRNEDNAFGTTWSTGFEGQIRVEALMNKRIPSSEKSITRKANYSPTVVSAKFTRAFMLEFFMLPPYMLEKLALIFCLDSVQVNGVQVQATEGMAEPEYIDRYRLANSSIKVEQVDVFGSYNSDDIGSVEDGGFIATETGFLKR